eukprot:9502347-Pyramimonas_sp.AAC.1
MATLGWETSATLAVDAAGGGQQGRGGHDPSTSADRLGIVRQQCPRQISQWRAATDRAQRVDITFAAVCSAPRIGISGTTFQVLDETGNCFSIQGRPFAMVGGWDSACPE